MLCWDDHHVILSREVLARHPESRSDERIAVHPRLLTPSWMSRGAGLEPIDSDRPILLEPEKNEFTRRRGDAEFNIAIHSLPRRFSASPRLRVNRC